MTQPLIELTTRRDVEPTATVAIDGTPYRLRTSATLSVAQSLKFGRISPRFTALHDAMNTDDVSPEQEAEYVRLLGDLAVMAVDAPEGIVRSLEPSGQMAVVAAAFFGMRPEPAAPVAPKPATTKAKPKTRKAKPKTRRRGGRSSRG